MRAAFAGSGHAHAALQMPASHYALTKFPMRSSPCFLQYLNTKFKLTVEWLHEHARIAQWQQYNGKTRINERCANQDVLIMITNGMKVNKGWVEDNGGYKIETIADCSNSGGEALKTCQTRTH